MWFPGPVSSRRRAVLLWATLACWAVAVLWLSSLTPRELPDAAFLFWDKLNHFITFAVGGWLAACALRASYPRARLPVVVLVAAALIAAFGVLDETLQTLTPGRTGGDIDDWMADVLGGTAGALLTVPLLRTRAPRT